MDSCEPWASGWFTELGCEYCVELLLRLSQYSGDVYGGAFCLGVSALEREGILRVAESLWPTLAMLLSLLYSCFSEVLDPYLIAHSGTVWQLSLVLDSPEGSGEPRLWMLREVWRRFRVCRCKLELQYVDGL